MHRHLLHVVSMLCSQYRLVSSMPRRLLGKVLHHAGMHSWRLVCRLADHECHAQVRDKEGAQQDMIDHGTAHKRKALQVRHGPHAHSLSVSETPDCESARAIATLECLCLQASLEGRASTTPFGAMIFTCNGRGAGLYGEPHWDSRAISSFVPVPSIGFFCNGKPP